MAKQKLDDYQKEFTGDVQVNDVFRRVRNFLAGRAVGITRDRGLLHEVVKCLFCKAAMDQRGGEPGIRSDDPVDIAVAYRATFSGLKRSLSRLFEGEELLLDPSSLHYVHSQLSLVDLTDPGRDPLGELYQAFISSDMRAAEGQFFTPQQAAGWLVEAVAPEEGQKVIDPACGTGGFLSYAARYLAKGGVSRESINTSIYGIEKDAYLSELAITRIALITLLEPMIVCGDSIEGKLLDGNKPPFEMQDNFDIVLTNPPFGARIKVGSQAARRRFALAYKWKRDRRTGQWSSTNNLASTTSPQILFLELCLSLLKPCGIMGVVVPESLVSSTSGGYVVNFLRKRADVVSVVGMPESLFKTSGKGGTHTKTCLLVAKKRSDDNGETRGHRIFMAEAKWCGHDSRGHRVPYNDLPAILQNFRSRETLDGESHLGYVIDDQDVKDNILAPRYYDPEPMECLAQLKGTHELVSVGKLVEDGVLSFSTGYEPGKLAYGTGDVPFVRTSDISNWEIKLAPKHGVSDDLYEQLKGKQDVREGDILMVRDGTYLIGACAYISKYDERIVYQSHIYKIRVEKPKELSPFLLLALLSSEPVVKQVRAKRFTQDIIDSLGSRVFELILPVPRSAEHRAAITKMVESSIRDRVEARELSRKATQVVVAPSVASL